MIVKIVDIYRKEKYIRIVYKYMDKYLEYILGTPYRCLKVLEIVILYKEVS